MLKRSFAVALLALSPVLASAQVSLPSGFTDALVTSVGSPTALAFTPDGRMLITTQGGTLRVVQGGTLLPTPAITFGSGGAPPICSNFERGLLGIAIDPDFATNNHIYLFYSTPTNPAAPVCSGALAWNRVSRFVLPAGNVINPATELILIDRIKNQGGNHNAGDLQFGRDGLLYISTGDGGTDYAGGGSGGSNNAARDREQLLGKILRINKDGTIPASNPFQGPGTVRCNTTGANPTAGNHCQETFAWGLRNPFRFAFDPNSSGTRFFINDVGQNNREEIDLGDSGTGAPPAGNDYGWSCREGMQANPSQSCTAPGAVEPVFDYSHSGGCASITGGAFVPNGLWPGFDNFYLYSDYVCGTVFQLSPAFASSNFATNLGGSSAVHLRFGPFGTSQALYYTTFAGGGQVRRISYSAGGANNAPSATAAAAPISGAVPLNVTFDATGSVDPDAGNTLTYFWDFGDGTPVQSTSNLTIQHSFTQAVVRTVTLRARDNNFAFSTPVTLTIYPGDDPPVPVVSSPAAGTLFRVGQLYTLTGSATDPQDGTLPASSLSWTVLLHHNIHTHPYLGPIAGNNVALTAPAPEDLAAVGNSYLEVYLTATDSQGLPATTFRQFNPRIVNVSFATVPAGLNFGVNGSSFTGPQVVPSWDGYSLNVSAPSQIFGGRRYVFGSWSDGGAASHAFVTPASAASLTATFRRATIPVDFDGNGLSEAVIYRNGAWLTFPVP